MTETENKNVLAYMSEAKSWQKQLERNENGNILNTYDNAEIIFKNDPKLKNMIGLNSFTHELEVKYQPYWRRAGDTSQQWTDKDDGYLEKHFESEYNIHFRDKAFPRIIEQEADDNAYHPIKSFIEGEDWDGVERVEYVFIDYLGAENSHYIRQATRKWLIAGVTRIYEAGVKFDEILMLMGGQGAGKSYIARRLAVGKWFNESLKSFAGEEPMRKLGGAWIVELAELTAMSKSTIEEAKSFLAAQEDTFRHPYARRSIKAPRQCIFIGTTNTHDFLKDDTGNRRFLPVTVDASKRIKSPFGDELSDEVVQQIWAEAYHYYKQGEGMLLDAEAEKVAAQMQESHTEDDPLVGEIEEFLNRPITNKYWELDVYEKRSMVIHTGYNEVYEKQGYVERDKTCANEIWKVMMGNLNSTPKKHETRKINLALDQLDTYSKDKNSRHFGKDIGKQRGYTLKSH